jgi:DNA-directed RNA polymerase beta' subunit
MPVTKEQVNDTLPKRFKGLKFGIQSNQDIANQAVVEISNRLLYDIENERAAYRHGPLDPQLGISNKTSRCQTCNELLHKCTGHFGYVKLPLPVFHAGYLRFIMSTLQEICKVYLVLPILSVHVIDYRRIVDVFYFKRMSDSRFSRNCDGPISTICAEIESVR